MKVVLDTNVILAGLATRGLCESVVALCLDRHKVILSEPILAEVEEHLTGKFKMPPEHVRERVNFLREQAKVVIPNDVAPDACRDKDDCAVLGTVTAGAANCLVTGDNDLLTLKQFEGVPILSPREFYEQQK